MTLRIGTLGAARITPTALIRPARQVADVEVVAVAARDPERAARFARKHGIPTVHASYDDLLADPAIDAVYNPLPNSHHSPWTLRALDAGKHVLCEKPFAANADEAREVADAATRTGLVVMEAFHWRYHPAAARMVEIVRGGTLGTVRHIDAVMCVPLPLRNDIRYRLDLAGGAQMDVGAYTAHIVRTLGGGEPEATAARARLIRPGVDRRMDAELRFADGTTARTVSALLSARALDVRCRVVGDAGELRMLNPVAPQIVHRMRTRSGGSTQVERFGRKATYTYQLEAFRAAVRDGTPTLTPPAESIRTMAVIDGIYRAAGLDPRGGRGTTAAGERT